VGAYTPQRPAGKVLAEMAHARLMEQGCVGQIRPVRRRRRLPKSAAPAEGSVRPLSRTGSDGASLDDIVRVLDGAREQQTERSHTAC
jgi:hypothetical protein